MSYYYYYYSIKTLICHIDNESRRSFKGTKFEDNYYFYHDALTQMTDLKCVKWMKEEGIYERWIKPELGCNDEVWAMKDGELKKNTRYKGRPVGNCPELMPLDNSLFRDFRLNLSLNVAATWHLDKKDLKKFSLATPNEITRAMERLWDPENGTSPSGNRIIQDVKRVENSCFKIVENCGKIVPGLADRNGHRASNGRSDEVLVGNVPKQEYVSAVTLEKMGLHHSIRDLVKVEYEKEKVNFFSNLEQDSNLTEASIFT